MSLGTFSRTFREIIGETPSSYRERHEPMVAPNCVQMWAMRPRVAAGAATATNNATQSSSFGEAGAAAAP
jgi:AraC-like DNA-binding protein